VLKQLAAEKLSLPETRLKTAEGTVFDTQHPAKRVTYGQLTAGKVIERHLETLPPLKPYSEYTISGKPYFRRDSRAKVTGAAQYAADIRLPKMVYARILRPPAHGAKLLNVDTSAAEKLPEVQVVKGDDLIAVLHPRPDGAADALAAIKASFDLPKTGIDDQTIYDHLVKHAPAAEIAGQAGDLAKGEKASAQILEETYLNAYVAHAPIEPHTALASVEGDRATVWASTQSPFGVQRQVAGAIGLPAEKVRVITPFVGGGFGGKAASAQAIEAARLAKRVGRPVMVAWTREEEFFFDTFRPAAVVKIKAGLDAAGHISLWDYQVYFAGRRGSENFYTIPHHREEVYGEWHMQPGIHPFAVGPWRAPAANTNTYARDLHLHTMASLAGADPLAFRLNHLDDKRMRRVLEAAARQFGWKTLKTPSGRGYGISCGIDAETYVAAMAEVEVDHGSGAIAVKRVVCAQDMGQVVNPQGATIQMEGCITMGLGYALSEELRFDGGEMLDTNFDTYEIPRFSWLPRIETVLVKNDDLAPQGGGEPAIIPMGAAIANAVFDATGERITRLPLLPQRLQPALAKRRAS
jgi:isoquinoline 1-oxidoreductase